MAEPRIMRCILDRKEGDGRLHNIVYFSFVLLMFINEFYICGRIDAKANVQNSSGEWVKTVCLSPAGALTAAVLIIGIALGVGNVSNATIAKNSMENGEAQAYSQVMYQRYELLKNSIGQDVRFEGLYVRPQLLYFADVSTDPYVWPNTDVCAYFDLSSVAIY